MHNCTIFAAKNKNNDNAQSTILYKTAWRECVCTVCVSVKSVVNFDFITFSRTNTNEPTKRRVRYVCPLIRVYVACSRISSDNGSSKSQASVSCRHYLHNNNFTIGIYEGIVYTFIRYNIILSNSRNI